MNTQEAEDLLKAATGQSPECTCPSPENFHEGGCPWTRWIRASIQAESTIQIQAPATLAVAIKLAEATTTERTFHDHMAGHACGYWSCTEAGRLKNHADGLRTEALAEWGRLGT